MRPLLPVTVALLLVAPPAARASETLAVPAFRSVDLRGGGNILFVPGATQRVTLVEGTTRLTRLSVDRKGRLTIEGCRSDCPRAYQLRIHIQMPRVPDVAIAGGGSIRAGQGFRAQDRIAAAIHGGGKIDLRELNAGSASVAIVGGGEILIRARSNLLAAITGGGAIRYWGNPQVSSAIRSGGWISRGT